MTQQKKIRKNVSRLRKWTGMSDSAIERRSRLKLEHLEDRVVPTGPSSSIYGQNVPDSATQAHIFANQVPSILTPVPITVTAGLTQSNSVYNPANLGQQAALAALAKSIKAVPQYLILPAHAGSTAHANPAQGEGPAGGYTPQQIQGAYGVNLVSFGGIQGDGAGQTIAVIDAGDDPAFVNSSDPNFASSDLHIFDQTFGLPDPPSFQKFAQDGSGNLPGVNPGWPLEISLDIEWSHALAPAANIIIVEGNTSSFDDLGTAARTAATTLGANIVSQSFGGFLEFNGDAAEENFLDSTYYAPALAANPGVTFLAATGDGGASFGPIYPAISPLTVGVGGTTLNVTGNTWESETGWSAGGGGISNNPLYTAPAYQQAVSGNSQRTNPDVAADADLNTGVSVYDSFDFGGFVLVGGTSVSTPIWGGMISIADQGRVLLGGQPLNGPNQTLPGLYSSIDYTNNYHDITEGNNFFPAGPGYDLVTGIGTPMTQNLLPKLALFNLGPAVVSASPAAGSIVTPTPPTTFSLTFSEPIVPASIVASDFTVNGIGADSASLSADGLTITYAYNTTPVTSQGTESISLPVGSVVGVLDGQANHAAFSESFFYVQTQLAVLATSPSVGSVLTGPNTDIVVQFNEAFNPNTVAAGDFQVSQGTVVKAVPLTPTTVDLTLSGVTLDGILTLTLPTGGMLDTFGVPNLAFSGSYIIQVSLQPYPTPLQGKSPAGSLIYDPSATGAINFPGDSDTYTLPLAAGQSLSLVLATTDPAFTGTITLLDPSGNVVATATASSAGTTAVIETAPINTAGTYSLVVTGSGETPGPNGGGYSLQAILNAVYKQATDPNNSIATAYNLDAGGINLNTTPAAFQAGVVGTLGAANDYYTAFLLAGQLGSVAVKGNGGSASVAIYDGSGNLLALGDSGKGVDSVVSDFVAPAAGFYYIQVSGAAGLQYDLVATLNADFGLHGNSFNTAQPLNGANVVLGSILKSMGALFTLDDQLYGTANPIWQTDPTTGAFIPPSINAPGSPLNNPFGLNLAYDGTNLYYESGAEFGTGTLYKLDPTTGAVLASANLANGVNYAGLAYLNGNLYATNLFTGAIDIFNASTFAFESTITSVSGLTGLAGDPDRDVLWGVAQAAPGSPGTIYEIDPSTGAVIKQGNDNNQGLNEQDIAYANGELIISDTNGLASQGGTNQLDVYNPDTLAFIQSLPVAVQGFVSGLGGDGLGGISQDWYQFNVNAGDNLVLTTTTPGGNSGNGLQFINDLDPTINLYDASGNLVATATGNAADGRNDVIDWTALTPGSYRVQILGASKTNLGEYTISVQGATGGLAPFNVTSTTPAAGSDLPFEVSDMTVSVSDSTLLTSVSPSDFTIDGNAATGVTVINSHTFDFTFATTADGVHNVAISGLVNIHGVALTPDSFSFQTDTVPPSIVSSSLVEGSVFSPAPQTVTEVVTFSEPMNTTLTPTIDLFGEIRNVDYGVGSTSWDPTGTILTISYANLPSDAYQFNLFAFGFQDLAGNTLTSGLTINFTVTGGTSSITGLQPVQPLGSLVYEATVDNVLVSSSDVDSYNLTIDPHQTLAVIVTPVSPGLTLTVTLISPTGHVLGVATSPSAGAPAVLPGVQSSAGGTYTIEVTGGPGEYTVEPVLNALVDPAAYGQGSDASIATAQPLDPYANKFAGNDTRAAVLGSISGTSASFGDALAINGGLSGDVILIDKGTGAVLKTYTSPAFSGLDLFDVALAPDNTFYVLGDLNGFTGVIIHMDLKGDTLGTITLPVTDNPGFLSPEGFGLDPRDGSFWVPLTNSAQVLHVDSNGNFLNLYPVGSNPNDAAVGPDGLIYITQVFSNEVSVLDPSTGSDSFFASAPFPINLTWSAAGDLWVGTINGGAQEFNSSGALLAIYDGSGGVIAAEPAPSGNVWDTNVFSGTVNQFSSSGSLLTQTSFTPFQNGLAVLGDVPGELPLPLPTSPVYSFSLDQGQSATLAIESLNGQNVQFALYDENGNLLAVSSAGATNYTQGLNNFVAPADGTYYVKVTGDAGTQFNLVLTKGADFTTQKHTTLPTSQDITATQQSGNSNTGGALGYILNPNGANVQSTIEGIDFNGSDCGCLPPDTNAAVGNGFVAEAVNLQFRVWDETGKVLLDESLTTLFGQTALSDPYVEYDAGVGHWYVTVIGSANESQVMLAISTDANPLDGFSHVYNVPVAASGDLADFPKFGYNADAIVIEANDFGDGHSVVTVVDKAQAIAGTLVDFQSTPAFNFRALTPAQMTGASPGDPMWFIASTGDPSVDGSTPNTIRVTEMTNILSNSPVYTDFAVGVNTYGPNSGAADQPGAPGSVATNDVTTTQVDYLNGMLVTAFSASTPADGFQTTKAHWYEVDVSGGTPTLVQEGLIDPGPGVATFFPSATLDAAGDIGITYMESSSTEFVSAYVAGHIAGSPLGTTTAGAAFAPGAGSMPESFREGDYSSVVYDPSSGLFWAANEYSGPNASSDIWNTRIASFSLFSGPGTDYYSVNANAGDNLHFATTTPSGGPNEFINNFYPELLLYDPNGNLVAVAAGNASDGRNSVIDFTVPDGDAGAWTIEVTPSPNTAALSSGEYGLLVTVVPPGALAPFVVTASAPAAGAVVQPPSTVTITFNHSLNLTSLTAGELEVNGVAATAVTDVNANTVSWTIDPGSFSNGIDVPNVVTLGADAFGNQIQDVSGQTLTPYSFTFFTTNVPPAVVSSSVDGSVFSPAPASVTEVVTFNQPMNTAATTAASFDLHGNYRNQDIAASSFSWDPTGTILTINFTNVPDDTYTLTLFAGGFQNLVGETLAGDYVANFAVALGTAAFPTPLTPIKPLGDLIYTGSDSHVLVTSTDMDGLTLALNAGGTLTLVATPTSSTQQLVVTVLDPSDNVIATSTASAAGDNTLLETVSILTTGTYTIEINDAGGALGLYSIQAYLNTALKVGTTNDSIGTAQDLTGSSYGLGSGSADRLAVVGSLPTGTIQTGDAFVASNFDNAIFEVNGQGQVLNVIPVPQAVPTFGLSGIELSPVDNMLYAAVTTSFNADSVSGELVEINPLTGAVVGIIPLPDDPMSFGYPTQLYPFGFSIASDGTFWIAQSNSDNIIHVDASGNVLATFSTGAISPDSATINAAGNVYSTGFNFNTGAGGLYLLNTTDGSYSLFANEPNSIASDLTSTAVNDPLGNGVWVGDNDNGAQRFDQSGNLRQTVGASSTGWVQAQTDSASPSANVWASNLGSGELFLFDQSGNEQFAVSVPGAFGLTVWGVDNPNPPPSDTQDYYSFALTAGESTTVVADSLNGANVQIEIVDGSGNVLATGVGGSTNVSASIQNFVAGSTGTYYVEVTGDPGAQYSLTATRDANFSIKKNNTYDTAQPLTGTNGVLGALVKQPSPLFTLDDQLYGTSNPIWQTDPSTGAFISPSINAPGSPLNNPFGLNLAYDGTNLYYESGAEFGTGTLYKLDPTTGAVLASANLANGVNYSGLAYLNGNLYAANLFTGAIDIFNASTFAFESTITSVSGLTGLAGDPDRDVLWGVAQAAPGSPGTIYEIDPSTGAVIKQGNDNNQGLNEQDIAYANGELIISDTNGLASQGGTNQLDVYNPDTLAFIQSLPVAVQGFVSGLGGDGLGGSKTDDQWFTINVAAGNSLNLQSFTPSDQGGQFPNDVSVNIELYDTFGNLVATGTILPDGRNEELNFNAPIGGTYHIHVFNTPGTFGEYFLQVDTASYAAGDVAGQVYNDLNGSGTQTAGDPGLDNWEVDLFDANGTLVASQLTHGGGNYDFGGLVAGTYTVSEVLQSGWTETQPASPFTYTVTVTAGATAGGNVFGNFQDITISGEKFNDLNGNGVQDAGEPGLQGWTIDLLDSAGAIVATTVTDANGNYSFADVGPGTYTVQEELQPGWVQTDPAAPGTYTVTAASGQNVGGLVFGNFQLVTISGTVYNDLNGSGSIAAGDPGLNGWTVDLLDMNGNVIATTTSAADGSYSFSDIFAGVYTVEEISQSGWYQTDPVPPGTYSITVTSGSSDSALNFGNFQLVNVSGNVYDDLNGNGNRDPGEPGQTGWTVDLFNASGNLVASTVSDANGSYEFDNLFPGTFVVSEVLQSGWVQTQPVNPSYYSFSTQSGLNEFSLNFGNFFAPEVLSGTVYQDNNGDGVQEPGELGQYGWTINLVDQAGTVVGSTTSNFKGHYTLTISVPGTYTVQEVSKSGWIITEPVPSGSYSVPAVSGSTVTGLNFGNFHTVTFGGMLFNDIDGNGHNNGDPGLAGWTVDLINTQNGQVVASVLTQADGTYRFTNVGPGNYKIAQEVEANWVQTWPLYQKGLFRTAVSGQSLFGLIFGDHADPALSANNTIGIDDTGYSTTGHWSDAIGGYNGINQTAKTTTGAATATATFDFKSLPVGTYEVFITYQKGTNYSTAAPFKVTDGTHNLGTQLINESIFVTESQGGRNQGSYGNVGWIELGSYAISSGELEVILSNNANGNFVDASGVLLVLDPAPANQQAAPGGVSSGSASSGAGTNPVIDATFVNHLVGASNSNGPIVAQTPSVSPASLLGGTTRLSTSGSSAGTNAVIDAAFVDHLAGTSNVQLSSNGPIAAQTPSVSPASLLGSTTQLSTASAVNGLSSLVASKARTKSTDTAAAFDSLFSLVGLEIGLRSV